MIMGDFNVWIEQNNSDSIKLNNMMSGYGFSQMVKKSTHVEGHTLDHVYVNECQLDINCAVGDRCDLSTDHYPVTFSIPSEENNREGEIIRYRNKKNLDVELLKSDLQVAFERIDFENGGSFEEKYAEYKNSAEAIIDNHAPMITKTLKPKLKIPWMD